MIFVAIATNILQAIAMTTTPPHIELDNFWPYQAIVLADQISRHTLEIVRAEADINQSQWRVLAAVADKPGRTAAEVTAVTPMDKTIVSRAVSSLIDAKLIEKSASPDDKRRMALNMTKSGQEVYGNIAAALTQTLSNITQTDTFEFLPSSEAFVDILKAYSRALDELTQT